MRGIRHGKTCLHPNKIRRRIPFDSAPIYSAYCYSTTLETHGKGMISRFYQANTQKAWSFSRRIRQNLQQALIDAEELTAESDKAGTMQVYFSPEELIAAHP